MKKFTLLALAVASLFLATAPNLSAQTEFALEWGVITDKSFSFKPFLWTAGLTLDFYLNPDFSLSPEVFMIVQNFDFGGFFLAPGILLNYQGTDFFIGGGLTKWWLVGSEVEGAYSTDVAFKANVGYKSANIKLTVFAITSFNEFFKEPVFGATFALWF
jgi:hypothetical protein